MKISVNKILYHFYGKVHSNYKYNEFQVSFLPQFMLDFDFSFSLRRSFGTLNLLDVCVFGFFVIHIYHSKNDDHAGFYFNLNILGLDIDYSYKDVRHYDHDNDTWEECDIESINNEYDKTFK